MQIVYRARSLAAAQSASSVLAQAGITCHIADEALWNIAGQRAEADVIRVLVDNRLLDHARRALRAWQQAQAPGF